MEDAITELENLKDAGSENEVQVKRAEILLNLLGNTSGTGIFYVPLEENDKNSYDTLYFRDLNPESYSRTNADIYVPVPVIFYYINLILHFIFHNLFGNQNPLFQLIV